MIMFFVISEGFVFFIANIPNEVRFNSLTIQDCFQRTTNTSGTIALCIMNNRLLMGKAAVGNENDGYTGTVLNGYITIRYY